LSGGLGMVWLVLALLAGLAVGFLFRLPSAILQWIDCSIVFSLILMLVSLGIEAGNEPKLHHLLDHRWGLVVALLGIVAFASLLWGWVLERGLRKP